ncbi:multicopper oxidase family protein [Aliiroseovarius sp. 2305UL8-7]|uniref:multicopper oxidase family protein n=1 Tax=Aliiroseovarius conchicola TaxID=3121637 RepID=UPI0035275BE8
MSTRTGSEKLTRRNVLLGTAAVLVPLASGMTALQFSAAQAQSATSHRLVVDEVDGRQSYNGKSLGPTIRALPGETIDVELVNNLPPLHDDCTANPNQPHGLNTTNLHTHGLHVSPTTDSSGEFDADNVFVSVVPEGQIVACEEVCGVEVKTSFRYGKNTFRFELPDNHASGTFWYHAHKHGSTGTQVSDGLAGPLIIDDLPGTMPAYIEEAVEKILFITNQGVLVTDPDGGGELDPTIQMRPGEVQRWRVINGTGRGTDFAFLRPNLENLEMHLIAFDGLTLERRYPVDLENLDEPWLNPAALASGNRMDVIVRAPAEPQEASEGLFASLTGMFQNNDIARLIDINVEVAGEPLISTWSDDPTLPGSGLVPFDDTPLSPREIAFTRQQTIDLEAFNGELKQTMQLGTAEQWTVSNRTQVLHVYHIHVNPFLITHINGDELPADSPLRRWQDTIGVPLGGSVGFKTRFETFTGKFVIHCHVLPHEDNGMMQIVEVVA